MWLQGALPQAPSLAWEPFNVPLDKIVGCGAVSEMTIFRISAKSEKEITVTTHLDFFFFLLKYISCT